MLPDFPPKLETGGIHLSFPVENFFYKNLQSKYLCGGHREFFVSGKLKDKRLQDFAFFLAKLLAIWLSWKLFSWVIGEERIPLEERYFPALSAPWETLNDWLRALLLHSSNGILHLFGYETDLFRNYVLRVHGYGGIALGNYCLGFQLMYYFSMLMLISKLSPAKKGIAIIAGVFLIQGLNIFRITALVLIDVHAHRFMFLSHDYLFNALVAVVLLLFYRKMLQQEHPVTAG